MSGPDLWGTDIGPGEKNAYTMEIDEDCVAIINGICIDSKCEKGFRSSIVLRTSGPDKESEKELVIACVSEGASENVSIEVPMYNGDKIINKTNGKAKIHVFGSVSVADDIGDVMDGDRAENLARFLPQMFQGSDDEEGEEEEEEEGATVEEVEEDEEESDEEEEDDKMEETMADNSDDDDAEEEDDEEEGAKLLNDRFGSRAPNGKKSPKESKVEKKEAPKKNQANAKRKLSNASDSSNTAKKVKGAPSKDELSKKIKSWVKEESSKELPVTALGSKIAVEYKMGFKKLGLGSKMSEFLEQIPGVKLSGGKISLK